MSAFVVGKVHIDALVTAWIYLADEYGSERDNRHAKADEVGKMLWTENYKSVNYRYGRNDSVNDYEFSELPMPKMTYHVLARISQLGSCYGYQSCEHNEWEESNACKFLRDLSVEISHKLGCLYDPDTWEATERMIFHL
jgi:hypothetical protein